MIYLKLFWSFFQTGLFSFGGGYASLPLIQNQVVDINKWITAKEFSDLITISQMTPGPIAINSATFVGTRIAGVSGSLAATFGYVLPSCIIVSFLAFLYAKYKNLDIVEGILSWLRPAVTALISSAGISILITAVWGEHGFSLNAQHIDVAAVCLFLVGLAVLRRFKVNPVYLMTAAGVAGVIVYSL